MSAPTTSHPASAATEIHAPSASEVARIETAAEARTNKLAILPMVLAFVLLLVGGITYHEASQTSSEPCNFGCAGATSHVFGSNFAGPAR